MPHRNLVISNFQSLSPLEVLNWIAFDNFEGVAEPELEGDFVEFLPVEDESVSKSRSDATRELFKTLAGGGIEAMGYLSVEPLDGRSAIAGLYDRNRIYMNHLPERSAIPPMLWVNGYIDWAKGSLKGFDREYAGIVMDREKVLVLWPERSGAAMGRRSTTYSSPGRRPQYDEKEFLRLCVWEASRGGLPEIPAEFIRRMDLLLSSIWGENRTPADTWMKEKVGAIYDLRKKYEDGRK